MIQETSDNKNWTLNRGSTQSSQTGPNDDHTKQDGTGEFTLTSNNLLYHLIWIAYRPNMPYQI